MTNCPTPELPAPGGCSTIIAPPPAALPVSRDTHAALATHCSKERGLHPTSSARTHRADACGASLMRQALRRYEASDWIVPGALPMELADGARDIPLDGQPLQKAAGNGFSYPSNTFASAS